jgi:hypothetical protein
MDWVLFSARVGFCRHPSTGIIEGITPNVGKMNHEFTGNFPLCPVLKENVSVKPKSVEEEKSRVPADTRIAPNPESITFL